MSMSAEDCDKIKKDGIRIQEKIDSQIKKS